MPVELLQLRIADRAANLDSGGQPGIVTEHLGNPITAATTLHRRPGDHQPHLGMQGQHHIAEQFHGARNVLVAKIRANNQAIGPLHRRQAVMK